MHEVCRPNLGSRCSRLEERHYTRRPTCGIYRCLLLWTAPLKLSQDRPRSNDWQSRLGVDSAVSDDRCPTTIARDGANGSKESRRNSICVDCRILWSDCHE